MDFAKYVALLQTRALYLRRADAFEDKLEGSLPRSFQEQVEREKHGTPEDRRERRERVFLSCWHLNDHESAAMWSLYGKSDASVAIRTTYGRLIKVLADEAQVGLVRYADYAKGSDPRAMPLDRSTLDIFRWFFSKRLSYSHEQELRVMLVDNVGYQMPKQATVIGNGASLPVSLHDLLEQVFISPQAGTWFKDAVTCLTRTYGFDVPVNRSVLDAEALF